MTELRKLKYSRGALKATLTRAITFLESENAQHAFLSQLRERKNKIVQTWDQFNDIQSSIESIEEVDDAAVRIEFEESYFGIVSRFDQLIIDREAAVAQETGANHPQVADQRDQEYHCRLPKINPPKFAGGYDEWYPFRDTFLSMVHNVRAIPDIQKFLYLRGALVGKAAEIIESLEVSAANYHEAWQMLTMRYDKKRLIIQKHIQAIYGLPVLTKENHTALRELCDSILKHVRALKAIGRPTDQWGDLLVYLITSKLDTVTNKAWEDSLVEVEYPTLKALMEFLDRRCNTLEIIQKKAQPSSAISNTDKQRPQKVSSNVATHKRECPICHGEHFTFACESLSRMSIPDRIVAVKGSRLCINCLRSGHRAKDCTSGGCKKCSKKHNTLLHIETSVNSQETSQGDSKSPTTTTTDDKKLTLTSLSSSNADCDDFKKHAWLSTAIIKILNRDNKKVTCRALLDAGSQSNFITRSLAQRLGLELQNVNVPVVGVNQVTSYVRDMVKVSIYSRLYDYQRNLDCLVLRQITDRIPSSHADDYNINIPANLRLADPNFYIPGGIDLLLGADVFWNILCVGQIKATSLHPVLQKTLFGWILGGTIATKAHASTNSGGATMCNLITNQELDQSLSKFWEGEQCSERPNLTHEEKLCEEHFAKTTRRSMNGQFIVRLPFRENMIEQLGESKATVQKRFYALERRLQRDSDLKMKYTQFLKEYIELGHMEKVKDSVVVEPGYYLPHHPVFKDASQTTKCRVVFDASCKTSTGVSLNDTLMVGPVLQPELLDIILRFRTWQFVVTADVEKMYRQVLVEKAQRSYQRILWREDPFEDLAVYQLNTVTYGTASASYLATRALQEIAHIKQKEYPTGSSTILSDFYVDDLVTGADCLDQLSNICKEVICVLAQAGFNLRKWASNAPALLMELPKSSSDSIAILNKDDRLSTLGLQWHSNNDMLHYEVKEQFSKSVTKRIILANIARLFDPLGLLGPIIVTAKILIQRLWQLKIEWDEAVPLDIQTKWRSYEAQLPALNGFSIPRKVVGSAQPRSVELHGFCDASTEAYGACVYVKTSVHDHHEVHLLCAKSRVAPAKSTTLPRLELCAAHLLAQLIKRIRDIIPVKIDKTYYWSDSMIVLAWIRSDSRRWSVFVSNRVGQIQESTDPHSWNHVKTKDNPADAISRGVTPLQLIQSQLWWNGPAWLTLDRNHWEVDSTTSLSVKDLPEIRKTALITTKPFEEWSIFHTISSLQRLRRVAAYILRFINNMRTSKENRNVGFLTATELNSAILRLAKIIQGYSFSAEIKALQNQKAIPHDSKLLGLSPFMDSGGIIRVGGRLSHSYLPYQTKHPVVLPTRHPFTKMLIIHEHQRLLHAGPQATLASLRQRFWPISGRSAVRHVTRSCLRCFRTSPKASPLIMANLPPSRVSLSRPFLHCGIDYAGPFMIRDSKKRNSKSSKAYIAVFVCMACKAIHLELVMDLSTEAFLNAFKRFISRRGKPTDLYTDNGTNFVGASRELKELRQVVFKELQQKTVLDFLAQEEIRWHFNPPLAPHFGGIWEAAVKAMKTHLKRIAGNALLNYDEMETLLTQIEAVLNSRPIVPLSADPNDNASLTPAHFLIGDSLTAPVEPTLLDVKENRLSRWQRVTQMRQHFWKRWSNDYLNELQQRTKWKTGGPSLKPGQLVIVREDATPPLCWPLARVKEVHPSSDGVVRSATIQTNKDLYKRPATRLCPLPFDNEDSGN
ncbi:uncharacterized protein LOC118644954 [Monomorium pharaonis]|uniref:uncharacterized protein LOC118644954 n=1 Tax=Monomorium pharaonis TaxID=307658 RepID=UPI0017470BDC|nr:uncharacterized protein LOC118644954 [Monomorium pharaonis]